MHITSSLALKISTHTVAAITYPGSHMSGSSAANVEPELMKLLSEENALNVDKRK